MIKKKPKKSPKDIIEKNYSGNESVFVKFPGGELEEVTESADESSVATDWKKVRKLWRKSGRTDYTHVHTHPYRPVRLKQSMWSYLAGIETEDSRKIGDELSRFPSKSDLATFLSDDKQKTMVIAVVDNKYNELWGYSILRKTKNTPKYGSSPLTILGRIKKWAIKVKREPPEHFFIAPQPLVSDELLERLSKYSECSGESIAELENALKKIAEDYNLKYRFVSAKVKDSKHKEKKKGLEGKVIMLLSAIFLASSLLVLKSNLTGAVISDFPLNTQPFVGIALFCIGLILGIIGLRKYKKYRANKITTPKAK